jgi:hypothetical protein
MTIRETLINIVGGKQLLQEREADRAALTELYNAYRLGRFRTPPERLIEQLQEYGSTTVMEIVRQLQLGVVLGDTESARTYQLNESRYQWFYSPLAQWSVNVWTSYGLGESVTVTCTDEKAQELWEQTWNASSIFDDDNIQSLSENVLVDGDLYLAAFISIADGGVTFELLDTDEITEIVTNPDNKNQPLYYKREYSDKDNTNHKLYYPDWHAYFYNEKDLEKAGLAAGDETTISEVMDQNNGTAILVLHIAHNRKDKKSLHGWPILGVAAPYLDAHKEFVQTRLAVARNKASFVRETTVKGGSRQVAAVKNKFDSALSSTSGYGDTNPPPVGGAGTLVHNEGVSVTDYPMNTGAGDASTDHNMFAWWAGIGCGIFPTTMGLDTSRWATALDMDKVQAVQWSRYQSFWACQFEKMVEIVLLSAEKWGKAKFDDYDCVVSVDTLSLVDFPGVVTPISQMLGTMTAMITDGTLTQQGAREILQAMWLPVLTALGVEGVDEILSDEILGIQTEEERAQAAKKQAGMAELARLIYENRKIAEKVGSE